MISPEQAEGKVATSAPALTPSKELLSMPKADSVLSTPPTNTPISQSKPMDGSRRRFLAVAAFSSVAGAGSLATAAMASLGASAAAFS